MLQKCTSRTIELALNVLENKKTLTTSCYKERADILAKLGLFKIESFSKTIKRLDTECNVVHLAQYLLVEEPSISTNVKCICGNSFTTNNVTIPINVDVVLNKGFGFMQEAIQEGQTKGRICRKCKRGIEDVVVYGPHVIIDTTILTDDRYPKNRNLSHTLDSICKIVEIENIRFSLAGLVHWSPGHYIAYTKSGMYWHEYNDIGASRKSVHFNTIVRPHLIMYVCST